MTLPFDIITDPGVIEGYLTDASNTQGHAEALVRPANTDEVREIMTHCQRQAIPLTVTAQRTSTTGGPVPDGGWLLSMERMTKVLGPNHVQGGVILGEHQDALEQSGKLFPPDPTSRNECSIGAAIACNASGARTFRYGPIRPWVDAVEVVLPDGTVLHATRDTPIPPQWPTLAWTEPAVKTAAGFFPADNLLDLMIGQEGTLGIITQAMLRLTDAPEDVLSLLCFFADIDACLAFVNHARQGAERPGQAAQSDALNPRAIEFFDQHSLELARERVSGIPEHAVAALFIEIEHQGEPPLDAWWEALLEFDALAEDTIVASDESGRRQLHAVRHAVPAAVNEQIIANGMPKVGTDFAVPDTALGPMMEAYQAVSMPHVLFGHIGDNHLHLNLLPRSQDELDEARSLYKRLALRAVELGGTVSAEHGIGKIKRALLAEMVGPDTLEQFCALKHTIDPHWVLGRGTMLQAPENAQSSAII